MNNMRSEICSTLAKGFRNDARREGREELAFPVHVWEPTQDVTTEEHLEIPAKFFDIGEYHLDFVLGEFGAEFEPW